MTAEVKHRRRRGITRLSGKHQVTIPVDVLREAHLQPGDELRVVADGRGRLLLLAIDDPLDALIGSAPGISKAASLQELRDEWAR